MPDGNSATIIILPFGQISCCGHIERWDQAFIKRDPKSDAQQPLMHGLGIEHRVCVKPVFIKFGLDFAVVGHDKRIGIEFFRISHNLIKRSLIDGAVFGSGDRNRPPLALADARLGLIPIEVENNALVAGALQMARPIAPVIGKISRHQNDDGREPNPQTSAPRHITSLYAFISSR